MAIKIKEYVFQTEVEGHITATLQMVFYPVQIPTDKEKMSINRINAALSVAAKEIETHIEQQANAMIKVL